VDGPIDPNKIRVHDQVVDGQPALHFSLADTNCLVAPTMLTVAALDLTQPPEGRDSLVTLPNDGKQVVPEWITCVQKSYECCSVPPYQVLSTVRRAKRMQLAPEAANVVPLAQDVHGEKVVFKDDYGVVKATTNEMHAEALPESVELAEVLAGEVPLAKALSFMLRLGSIGLGCPVEIEFALKLRQTGASRHELHLLQIRPQAQVAAQSAMGLRFQYLPSDQYAVITSKMALGNGRFEGICDVLYVSPERFNKRATSEIAQEISMVNAQLQADGRKYLLMGPGRWGSSDSSRVTFPAIVIDIGLTRLIVVSPSCTSYGCRGSRLGGKTSMAHLSSLKLPSLAPKLCRCRKDHIFFRFPRFFFALFGI